MHCLQFTIPFAGNKIEKLFLVSRDVVETKTRLKLKDRDRCSRLEFVDYCNSLCWLVEYVLVGVRFGLLCKSRNTHGIAAEEAHFCDSCHNIV